VFNRIFAEPAGKAGEPETIMIDATHQKAHRTAARVFPRLKESLGILKRSGV
jgi:putative transposase